MIREFAEYTSKYKKDDYILYHDKDDNIEKIGKIVKLIWKDLIYYQIMCVDGYYDWISYKLAFRKATPEEINNFETKLAANKYNL